eukprot:TRINITY_DN949_c0_g1_i1.p1 TRINITY_DN949_c0_g1~~TRINITY_DN949_c0_g1_i1.p1  ORF type:complete len:234 (+),score=48.20 TRINITY_DN949_c0_g1_i1:564-1265(+)
MNITDWASDVEELCGHLKLTGKFDIIGISFGCIHALAVSSHLKDQARNVLLLGPHAPTDDPHFKWSQDMSLATQMMYTMPKSSSFVGSIIDDMSKKPLVSDPKSFINQYVIGGLVESEKEQFQAMDESKRDQLVDELAQNMKDSMMYTQPGLSRQSMKLVCDPWGFTLDSIQASVFIIACTLDNLTPASHSKYIKSKLQNGARLEVIEGGHMTFVFNQDKWLKLFFTWDGTTD